MAILAIIFGILQLVKSRKKGMAIAGIITAAVSIILATLFWIGIVAASEQDNNYYDSNPFEEYFEEYFQDYQQDNGTF